MVLQKEARCPRSRRQRSNSKPRDQQCGRGCRESERRHAASQRPPSVPAAHGPNTTAPGCARPAGGLGPAPRWAQARRTPRRPMPRPPLGVTPRPRPARARRKAASSRRRRNRSPPMPACLGRSGGLLPPLLPDRQTVVSLQLRGFLPLFSRLGRPCTQTAVSQPPLGVGRVGGCGLGSSMRTSGRALFWMSKFKKNVRSDDLPVGPVPPSSGGLGA